MADVLMPFAKDVETQDLVDVSEVKRGHECGCECLSCGMPVVAKQGDKKAWHFSHSTVSTSAKSDCEFSFNVALRAMILDCLVSTRKLLVPPTSMNTTPKLFEPEEIIPRSSYQLRGFDAVLMKGKYVLGVFVARKPTRMGLSSTLTESPNFACLSLDPKFLFSGPYLETGNYRSTVERFITEQAHEKSWIYHPKIPKQTRPYTPYKTDVL